MRTIDTIVVHCAATRPSQDIGATEIDGWHRQRGFSSIGYHAVIRRNGKLEQGRAPYQQGAHAKGHNSNSVGVCLVGGISEDGAPRDNFTPAQYNALKHYLDEVQRWYGPLNIIGHRDIPGVSKACPSFDVAAWLDS